MAQRIPKRMPAPDGGVRPGQTANIKLPTGSRYHDLQLVTNMPLAQIAEIRVFVNGTAIHRYSGEERDQMNQHYEMPSFGSSGVLHIPFDRWNMKRREFEELTAINTGSVDDNGRGVASLYVEVDISDDDTITGYVATPTIDPYATISPAQQGGQGVMLHVKHHTRNSAGAGELQLSDLPFNQNTARALSATFIWPKDKSTGDPVSISKLTVERGLNKVFERPDALNRFLLETGYRKPQTGLYAIDFTEKRYAENALDLQGYQDFRYLFQMAGEAQMTIISEYLGGLPD